MLELKGITKVYPTGSDPGTALRGIDLTFRKSEFVSILGPSGCGKTTMLNILGGLDGYTEGDLVIDGMKVYNAKELEAALRKAGFTEVSSDHYGSKPWIALLARK